MTLEQLTANIFPPDAAVSQAAMRRWNAIAKPLGSLGLLEPMVCKLAGILGTASPDISRRAVVVLCADNGVVEEGVTQCGSEVTTAVAENLTRNATGVCCMASVAKADVVAVDLGVKDELTAPGILRHKIARGTRNMTTGPAMTREQALDAVLYCAELTGRLKERGYRLIAAGEMGIGNTTTSSAVASVLLSQPPERMTGRGAGLSNEGLLRKIDAIGRAIECNRPDPADPLDVVAKVGGFDIAGMMGLYLGGALHRIPVVLDGFISTVAALAAVRLCPDAAGYLLPSHQSQEPAARLVLDALGMEAPIRAQMRLGEGTGAVALLPLLDMALAVYSGMPTFAETEIEEYQPLT